MFGLQEQQQQKMFLEHLSLATISNSALGSPAADPKECPLKVRKQKARLKQLHRNCSSRHI